MTEGRSVRRHQPQRGDDVEAWLRRRRNLYGSQATAMERDQYRALDALLGRYRECADYGIRKGALQRIQFKHFDHQRKRLTIFTKGQKVRELSSESRSEASSGQWCVLHNCHQDDPRHDYSYPECERHLREATATEERALRRRFSPLARALRRLSLRGRG